jgi:hypothetical protein
MNENLAAARDCAKFTAQDLRAALSKAGAVEALVILPLIAEAERLTQQIEALILARSE